jgi:hypothetical protein
MLSHNKVGRLRWRTKRLRAANRRRRSAALAALQLKHHTPAAPGRQPRTDTVGTLRRDYLDHILVFSESHAERILREYVRYYHGRPHRGLRTRSPAGARWHE